MLASQRLRSFLHQRAFWTAFLSTASLACFSVALLAYAYAGLFSHYIIDDYCVAAEFRHYGFFGAQKYWYVASTGRFTLMLALSAVELIGQEVLPLLPALALILWLIGLRWTISQFRVTLGWLSPTASALLLAELVIYATLRSVPNLYQVLFWVGGMLTYVAPLVLLTVYVGFIKYQVDRQSQNWRTLLASGGLAFIAGGFSETSLVLQSAALLFAIAACSASASVCARRALPLLTTGFVGCLLALVVTVLSPGNAARQSTYPPPADLLPLAAASLRHACSFVAASTRARLPLSVSVTILLPALLAFALPVKKQTPPTELPFSGRIMVRALVLSSVAVFILIVLCLVPSIYATSSDPLPRTLVVPQYMLVCFIICWGYCAGASLRRVVPLGWGSKASGLTVMVLILLALGPLTSAVRTFVRSRQYQSQAAAWNEVRREIRHAQFQGMRNVRVAKPYDSDEFDTLSDDSNFVVNRCVASYYNLDSIRAK